MTLLPHERTSSSSDSECRDRPQKGYPLKPVLSSYENTSSKSGTCFLRDNSHQPSTYRSLLHFRLRGSTRCRFRRPDPERGLPPPPPPRCLVDVAFATRSCWPPHKDPSRLRTASKACASFANSTRYLVKSAESFANETTPGQSWRALTRVTSSSGSLVDTWIEEDGWLLFPSSTSICSEDEREDRGSGGVANTSLLLATPSPLSATGNATSCP